MDKIVETAARALGRVDDGAVVAVGGFGPAGVPLRLIDALLASGATNLHLVTNNVGDGWGLGLLLDAGRVSRITMSYMGQNKRLADRWLAGAIDIEFTPQGTMVERLRAAGAGIPAFYTPTGVGTFVADGGLPISFRGTTPTLTLAKEVREFGGRPYVLEEALFCDLALVHSHRADRFGNLAFRSAARNFNPVMATAARRTAVESEQLVAVGDIPPDDVHLPGAWVAAVVGGALRNERVDVRTTTGARS